MGALCFEKIKRGQIWIIRKSKNETVNTISDKNNHIVAKSRPWVIVSNNISNDKSPIVNCVPITSRITHLPMHVLVRMEKGDCCVQCEQITTLNKSDFDNATYVGHMNEGIMQKIEIALANQLGVSVQVPSLEELENIIEKIANSKAESIKNESIKVTDNYVISVIDKLQKAFNITDEAIKIEDTNIKSIIKNARKKWTREEMEIFIQDSEQMSTEDMSKKYNMSIKTVYSTKYRFRNTLNNMEVAN